MPRRWTNANNHSGISPVAIGGLLDQLRYEWGVGANRTATRRRFFVGREGSSPGRPTSTEASRGHLPPVPTDERDEETHE